MRENPVDEKLKILQPILGTMKVHRLRQLYFFEDDFRQKREIENHIDLLISRFAKKNIEDEIILPPPTKELCEGDIDIGKIEYLKRELYPIKLKLKDINRHVGIFGSTGSGKTTCAKNLIRRLYKKNIPFLIFDWEKSYRNLIREYPDVQVFTVGKDINPLFLNFLTVPPGIAYDEYIKSIIAIISEDYIGGIGADTMLLNYMEKAFEETKNPFFEDLKQVVIREINKDRGKRGRLAGRAGLWKESVSRQITFMSKGAAGNVVNPRKHYPLESLFSKPIVLEFGNLKSPYDRKFFIHVILNWLAIYNHYHGIQSENLQQVLIFEEFHNIVIKGREDNMVSNLFRESRKYGIGLIAIDQTPSEIPNSIFANVNSKISFALGTNTDISAMAKAMNLDSQKSRYLGMLKTGQAIINVKQRHHDSFLIRAPFVKQEENIRDEELRGAMEKFSRENDLNRPGNANCSRSQTSQVSDTTPHLTPLEKILLTSMLERPLDGVDQRTRRLGFHPGRMVSLHATLAEKGIIKSVTVDKKKLFEVTDEGKIIAEELNIPVPKRESNGGIEHAYWISQILQFLKKHEFQPACEIQGIDIVDLHAGIAIEVETGKSDMQGNAVKLKNSRFSALFMLATNKPTEIKLKALTHNYPAIRIFFVKDFLKLPKEEILNSSQHPPS